MRLTASLSSVTDTLNNNRGQHLSYRIPVGVDDVDVDKLNTIEI